MRVHQAVSWTAICLLLVLGLDAVRSRSFCAQLKKDQAALQSRLAEAQQAHAEAMTERDTWKDEADRLRSWAGEVHQLRAEVTRLTTERASAQSAQESSSGSAATDALPVQTGASGQPTPIPSRDGTVQIRKGVIPMESAPPVVAAAILREVGGGTVKVSISPSDDGQATYGVKGQLPDGRGIGLRLAEDGAVLERSVEIPADQVPAHIQGPVSDAFGSVPISGAREIRDGESVLYELVSKSPDMGLHITVREDGAILAYEAKLKAPKQHR